jgi:uncharacterized C2H2 Zn-finger protein
VGGSIQKQVVTHDGEGKLRYLNGREQDAEQMFWCPKCEAWYCKDHTSVGFWDNIRRCPKKHEIPKGQG